jgi:hypothetical protein
MIIDVSMKHADEEVKPNVTDYEMTKGKLYLYGGYGVYYTLSNDIKMIFLRSQYAPIVQNFGFNSNKNIPFRKGTVITLTQCK